MTSQPKQINLAAIQMALKGSDSFISGLFEILNLCASIRATDFDSVHNYISECISIIQLQAGRRSQGVIGLIIQVINHFKQNAPGLFNGTLPGSIYVSMIMQALGFEKSTVSSIQNAQVSMFLPQQNSVQNVYALTAPSNGQNTPNNVNFSDLQGRQIAQMQEMSPRLPNLPISSFSSPHNMLATSQMQINNPNMNYVRVPDMMMYQQQNNQAITATDLNGTCIQLVQHPNQGQYNPGSAYQFVGIQNVQQIPQGQRPQQIPFVVNSGEDPQNLNVNSRFSTPVNQNLMRPNQGNMIFMSPQHMRPTHNGVQIPTQNQLINPGIIVGSPQGGQIVIPGTQQIIANPQNVGMRRGMGQQLIMPLGIRNQTPNPSQQPLIRQHQMFIMPQQFQGAIQGQNVQAGIPQNTVLHQDIMLGLMGQNNSTIWQTSPGQFQQVPMTPSVNRDLLMPNQQTLPIQVIRGQSPIQPFLMNNGVNTVMPSPKHIVDSRMLVPSIQTPMIQRPGIARPVSNTSKPSTIHYHPTTEQLPVSTPEIPNSKDAGSNSRESNNNNKILSEAQILSDTLLSHSAFVDSSIETRLKSFAPASNCTENMEVGVPPCTIRLCVTLPMCDPSPSKRLLEECLTHMTEESALIVSIPESTFLRWEIEQKPHDHIFQFNQSFNLRESIYLAISTKSHLDVQFRCYDNGTSVNKWPWNVKISLNGNSLNVCRDPYFGDESLLIKNFLKQKDNSLDIVSCIPAIIESDCEENNSSHELYHFGINLILKSSLSAMLKSLVNKRSLSVEKAKENLLNFFVENSLDNNRGYTLVDLYCPVGKCPIMMPVRGDLCRHVQCMDFKSLLEKNANRTHFYCPICRIEISTQCLIIDGFLCDMISLFKGKNVKRIKIKKDFQVYIDESHEATPPLTENSASVVKPINGNFFATNGLQSPERNVPKKSNLLPFETNLNAQNPQLTFLDFFTTVGDDKTDENDNFIPNILNQKNQSNEKLSNDKIVSDSFENVMIGGYENLLRNAHKRVFSQGDDDEDDLEHNKRLCFDPLFNISLETKQSTVLHNDQGFDPFSFHPTDEGSNYIETFLGCDTLGRSAFVNTPDIRSFERTNESVRVSSHSESVNWDPVNEFISGIPAYKPADILYGGELTEFELSCNIKKDTSLVDKKI